MDCSLPGSSVHGIFQARVLEWGAIAFSEAIVYGVTKSRTWLSNFTFTFHFPALEKEMATYSSVLAWRIPGTEELGGLPSMGSHRVGHDWSDLAAYKLNCLLVFGFFFKCFMDKLRSVLKLQHRSPASQSGTLLTSPRGFRCSMKLTVHKYEHFVSLYKTYEMYKTSDTKRLYKTSKHLIQKDCIRWLGFKDWDYPLELSFLILKYSTSHILIISVEPNELTYIA